MSVAKCTAKEEKEKEMVKGIDSSSSCSRLFAFCRTSWGVGERERVKRRRRRRRRGERQTIITIITIVIIVTTTADGSAYAMRRV